MSSLLTGASTMRTSAFSAGLILSAALAACGPGDQAADDPVPERGREVLQAMVDAHDGSRYRTLTFVQQTLTFGPDGAATDTSTWYEALAPGRLRIDVAPLEDGNGVLYRGGLRYTIRGGQPVDSTEDTNPLALILSDAFHRPVERTAATLEELGFDLTTVRRARWEDEPAWVVGAATGDSLSPQFWIERERRLPVRVISRLGDGGPLMDARIGGYTRIDGSWVEGEIDIRVDGRLAQSETYRRVRVNPELPEGLFDPYSWSLDEPYWE